MIQPMVTMPFEIDGGIAIFDRQHYSDYEEMGDLWADRYSTEPKRIAELFNGRSLMLYADNGRHDVSVMHGVDNQLPYPGSHLMIETVLCSLGFWLDVPSGEMAIADFTSLRTWKEAHEDSRRDGFHSIATFKMPVGAYRVSVNGYLIAGNPFNRSSLPLPGQPATDPAEPPPKPTPKTSFVRHIVFNINKMPRGMAVSCRKTGLYTVGFTTKSYGYDEAMEQLKARLAK
jgi:hypothetical protein